MENRNIHHPEAGQGSGQQQPDPPVPNPIVPIVPQPILHLRLPVPANQSNFTIPLTAEYQYTVVFTYGSGFYYYHYYHCYPCTALPDGGAVFWPTLPAPAPAPDPPRLEAVPEDEVVAPEIPGHDEVDEVMDQLQVLTFDMLNDNSYEELLALAEAIGNVSVGLSSEFIERNLNVRTFESLPTRDKCVICLDEFKAGENIGTLECGHEYHKHCIKRWLMDHNTCPLCMSPALRVD